MNRINRVNLASPALILFGYSFLAWVVLPAAPAGFAWDDTWYLLMAEWFSGRREHLSLAYEMMKLRQYPPLLPYLISMIGDGLHGYSGSLRLNVALLALSAALVMRWLFKEGLEWPIAMLAALCLLLNPVALEFSSIVLSEPLFLFLSTVALMLVNSEHQSIQRWVLVGLFAGLAIATRSAGWALAIGLLLHSVSLRNYRGTLSCLGGCFLGLLFMAYLKAGLPSAHTYTQGFLDNLSGIDAVYLVQQLLALYAGWEQVWGSRLGAILMLIFIVPGLVWRLRMRRADALYVLIYLAMLIAWPFPGQMGRFLWGLMPALLVAAATTASRVNDRKVRDWVSGAAFSLVFVLSVPGGSGRVIGQLLTPLEEPLSSYSRMSGWSMAPDRETGLMNLRTSDLLLKDMQRISGSTSGQDCVISEYPALVALHARRVSYASPWNHPDDIGSYPLRCAFYYLVPDALPAVSNADVARLVAENREIFRSFAPYEPGGQRVLGVFLELRPAEP